MDRRVRRTRAQLRQALTALLREKDLKDITVRELTDRADVNRGTFYSHYQDVYDMVFFLDEGDRWLDTYIYINSWKVVLQNSDL